MKINDPTAGNALPVHEALSSSSPSSANSGDAAWFSAALEQPDAPQQQPFTLSGHKPDSLFNQASSVFNHLDDDKKSMNSALRKASRSTDPLVLNKIDGELSNYYLESSMNAKIVSKTVQGLEKLTNLQ
ncbi:hypothetical protein PMPD1_1366 [Paramixta manurensis]|uniref:Type III secretion system protein n=1 Tax=Paramixta manurensis TaxID=2740817 RepID=A0A6M8U6T4_9GAMM|nr:hypothetical protein PMPD1_1366 [Erwiniaceae bacterium PD-1]